MKKEKKCCKLHNKDCGFGVCCVKCPILPESGFDIIISNKPNWEKEFEQEFLKRPYENDVIYANGEEVKVFIRRLLKSQQLDIKKMIEEKKKVYVIFSKEERKLLKKIEKGDTLHQDYGFPLAESDNRSQTDGYNEALSDILKEL